MTFINNKNKELVISFHKLLNEMGAELAPLTDFANIRTVEDFFKSISRELIVEFGDSVEYYSHSNMESGLFYFQDLGLEGLCEGEVPKEVEEKFSEMVALKTRTLWSRAANKWVSVLCFDAKETAERVYAKHLEEKRIEKMMGIHGFDLLGIYDHPSDGYIAMAKHKFGPEIETFLQGFDCTPYHRERAEAVMKGWTEFQIEIIDQKFRVYVKKQRK